MLTKPEAEYHARAIHRYRSDWPLPAVASVLADPQHTTGYSKPQVLAAAYLAVGDQAKFFIRAFSSALSKIGVGEWREATNSEPARGSNYPVLPVGARHCEIHDWCPPPPYCGACRSEQIALEPAHTPA